MLRGNQRNICIVHLLNLFSPGIYLFLQEVAFLLWKESWELSKNPMASRGSPLHGPRIKLVEKARDLFAETKEHNFESKAAEEHAKLLRCISHSLFIFPSIAPFLILFMYFAS